MRRSADTNKVYYRQITHQYILSIKPQILDKSALPVAIHEKKQNV